MGEKTIKNMKARKKHQRVRAKILFPSTLFMMVELGSVTLKVHMTSIIFRSPFHECFISSQSLLEWKRILAARISISHRETLGSGFYLFYSKLQVLICDYF